MNQNYFYKAYQPRQTYYLPCAVCGSDNNSLLAPENNLHIVSCQQCNYVYVNPRPGVDELGEFYQTYFPEQDHLPDSWGGEMRAIFSAAHALITQRYGGGTILDIGSAYGHFLEQFNPAQWQATGVEPSPNACDYCRERSPRINVLTGNFEAQQLSPGSFDVITSFYVLEHVFDPRDFMQRVHELLKPGGLAVIRIPYTRPFFGFARLLGRPLMYAPMHLNDFAPAHMARMCRDIGFADASITVGTVRESSNGLERLGAKIFGGLGRCWEALPFTRGVFPFAGAYTYLMRK